MKRCFIFQDNKSQKFWNIEFEEGGTSFHVNYGRLGTSGQTQEKSFATAEACAKEVTKMIASKVKKGYTETTEEGVKNAKDEAKWFGIEYDEYESYRDKAGNDAPHPLILKLQKYKNLDTLKILVLQNWGEEYEDNPQEILDWMTDHPEKFPKLESLTVGDMGFETCEISWIMQANYDRIWKAFPNLKELHVQGRNDLTFGQIESDSLVALSVRCGGLGADVMQEITKAKAPNLKKLVLYLGVDDYGFDCTPEDIHALLNDSDFPHLINLGLCNTDIPDLVLEEILQSKYAAQLEVLDLSMSTTTDETAQMLLDHLDQLPKLKEIDFHYHYLSDGMMAKLKKLPYKVDVSDQEEAEEYHGEIYRNPMFTE